MIHLKISLQVDGLRRLWAAAPLIRVSIVLIVFGYEPPALVALCTVLWLAGQVPAFIIRYNGDYSKFIGWVIGALRGGAYCHDGRVLCCPYPCLFCLV